MYTRFDEIHEGDRRTDTARRQARQKTKHDVIRDAEKTDCHCQACVAEVVLVDPTISNAP